MGDASPQSQTLPNKAFSSKKGGNLCVKTSELCSSAGKVAVRALGSVRELMGIYIDNNYMNHYIW
jgi:hypothetical protein